MRDPFRIEGPALINLSLGRSSSYMLDRIRAAHGGHLPADVHVVFANVGREREETLRFGADIAERWGIHLRWLERDGSRPAGARFREVEYETASRRGEPFEELIAERRYLPNPVARFCTADLKILVARDFMRAQGYDHWTSVVGLRRDEPDRVAKLRARDHGEWDIACPLYDARVTKGDVLAFWRAQDFDLALGPNESNCDGCFLRSVAHRQRVAEERPDLLEWWATMEERVGARFRKDGPSYRQLLDGARSQMRLPLAPADVADDLAVCGCTDRRLRRCTCGKRPGRGHALHCAHVLGAAA